MPRRLRLDRAAQPGRRGRRGARPRTSSCTRWRSRTPSTPTSGPRSSVYGDTLLLVLKTARYVDSEELVHIGEILVFAGPRFVVTVRHGKASPLHDVRLRLERRPELLGIGPSAVLYAVADRVVDDYATVIEGLAEDVDQVEEDVFSDGGGQPGGAHLPPQARARPVPPGGQPLGMPMERAGLAADGPAHRPAHGRLLPRRARPPAARHRPHRRVRRAPTGALQANLAQLQMRDNADIRRISAWVAILAVPTMVFGLYGMNFEHMPELTWRSATPRCHRRHLVLVSRLRRCGARAGVRARGR